MFKRIISLAVSASMLLSCGSCLSAGAVSLETDVRDADASGGSFTASNEEAVLGEEVTVKFGITDNPGIVSFRLIVDYDSDDLEITDFKGYDLDSTELVTSGLFTNDPFLFSWVDAVHDNNTYSGTVAEVTFRVKESASLGEHTVGLSYLPNDVFDKSLKNVTLSTVSGSINVVEEEDDPSAPSNDSSASSDDSSASSDDSSSSSNDSSSTSDNDSSSVVFSLTKAEGHQGDDVEVSLYADENTGIISFLLNIDYDDAVKPISTSADEIWPYKDYETVFFGPLENDPLSLSWVEATHSNNTYTGRIATFTFHISEDAEVGEHKLTLSADSENIFNYDLEDVPFKLINGSITVLPKEEPEPVVDTDPVVISISDAEGHPGDDVKVELSLDQNPGLISFRAEFGFDEEKLTLSKMDDVKFWPYNDFETILHSELEESPIGFLWSDSLHGNCYYEGKLSTLTFHISESAEPGYLDITLREKDKHDFLGYDYEDYDEDYHLPFELISGRIKVLPRDYEISETEDGIEIVRYLGSEGPVDIPDTLYGKPVVSIAANAFTDIGKISATIPESVTSIADNAFGSNADLLVYYGTEGYRYAHSSDLRYIIINDETDSSMPEFKYVKRSDGTAMITAVKSWKTNSDGIATAEIPETIGGLPVTALDRQMCSYLINAELTVPACVTELDDHCAGFYPDYETAEWLKNDGFTILCYTDSAAHKYAENFGISYRLLDTVVSGSIELHTSKADDNTDITLTIESADGNVINVPLASQGTFELEGLSKGEYTFTVRKPKYVPKSITFTVGGDLPELDFELYKFGDSDADGTVNMKDYSRLQKHLNDPSSEILEDASDMNSDGKINMKDYSSLQKYLNGWDIDLND